MGLYQHDVNQKQLAEALDGVVESVVNQVGVDVNTASPALLTYVAGIGPKLAEQIVAHRDENGRFPSRAALQEVKGLGAKAFEQAAGFLRVRDGDNPLDASAIHPESYPVATAVLQARQAHAQLPPPQERAGGADAAVQPTADAGRGAGHGPAHAGRHFRAAGASRPRSARGCAAAHSAQRRALHGRSAGGHGA